MSEKKHVIIQKRINEAIDEELKKFYESTQDDPLMRLLLKGGIEFMSLKEIKEKIEEI